MSDPEFDALATVTVEVRRVPAMTGTPPKRGAPVVVLAASNCTPFYPVSADTAARSPLDSPHTLRQTFTLDVWEKGDTLYIGGVKKYTVTTIADWLWPEYGETFNDVLVKKDET